MPCPAPPCRARPHHPSPPLRAQACPTRPALPVSTCPALPSRPRHQLTFLPETTIHTCLQCFGGCRVALLALSFEGWHTSIEIPQDPWFLAVCQSVEFGGVIFRSRRHLGSEVVCTRVRSGVHWASPRVNALPIFIYFMNIGARPRASGRPLAIPPSDRRGDRGSGGRRPVRCTACGVWQRPGHDGILEHKRGRTVPEARRGHLPGEADPSKLLRAAGRCTN